MRITYNLKLCYAIRLKFGDMFLPHNKLNA